MYPWMWRIQIRYDDTVKSGQNVFIEAYRVRVKTVKKHGWLLVENERGDTWNENGRKNTDGTCVGHPTVKSAVITYILGCVHTSYYDGFVYGKAVQKFGYGKKALAEANKNRKTTQHHRDPRSDSYFMANWAIPDALYVQPTFVAANPRQKR